MNTKSVLFLFLVVFAGSACERHSADSLPSHVAGGSHGAGHGQKEGTHEKDGAKPSHDGSKQEVAPPVAGKDPKYFGAEKSKETKEGK